MVLAVIQYMGLLFGIHCFTISSLYWRSFKNFLFCFLPALVLQCVRNFWWLCTL